MVIVALLNPISYVSAFIEGLTMMVRHWRLLLELTRRDLTQKYSGQIIGSIWVIAHPLFLTALYIFIFGVIFKSRLGGGYDMPRDYTAYILAGLVPWLSFQTSMNTVTGAILGNSALVKQFVFQVEVLPIKDVLTALVFWVVGSVVLLLYLLATGQGLEFTILLLPAAFFFQVLAMCGLAFLLSSITAFFRDLKDLVVILATASIYVLPIVYLPAWVPDLFKPILYINPFSYMIWMYQDILYFGRMEHPIAWAVWPFFSIFLFASGYRIFKRLKPMFSSVI